MNAQANKALVDAYQIHHQYWVDMCRMCTTLHKQGASAATMDEATATKAIAHLREYETAQKFGAAEWQELYDRRA